MNKNIFQRVEKKYLLSKVTKEELIQNIKTMITEDNFFESTICNIYFDTNNNDLIINSLERPKFKEKVRIRSYGIPTLQDEIFFEIKEKYKGIVGKRRIKIKLEDFYNYQNNKKIIHHSQIMKEIDYYFRYYQLKPAIYIAYDRQSYKGMEDQNLRITFDSNLRSRTEDLNLEKGDYGTKYFEKDTCIMEIKTLGAIPLWLVKELSNLKIYPIQFSKYGKIYQKNLSSSMEEIIC